MIKKFVAYWTLVSSIAFGNALASEQFVFSDFISTQPDFSLATVQSEFDKLEQVARNKRIPAKMTQAIDKLRAAIYSPTRPSKLTLKVKENLTEEQMEIGLDNIPGYSREAADAVTDEQLLEFCGLSHMSDQIALPRQDEGRVIQWNTIMKGPIFVKHIVAAYIHIDYGGLSEGKPTKGWGTCRYPLTKAVFTYDKENGSLTPLFEDLNQAREVFKLMKFSKR